MHNFISIFFILLCTTSLYPGDFDVLINTIQSFKFQVTGLRECVSDDQLVLRIYTIMQFGQSV